MPGEAVQLRGYLGGSYAALPVPLPLKPEWLALLLPAAAAEKALSLYPHGECLNRYLLRAFRVWCTQHFAIAKSSSECAAIGLYVELIVG